MSKYTLPADGSRQYLTPKEAIAFLPDGDTVHTFRGGGRVLLGCDWEKQQIIDAINTAKNLEVTGTTAQSMRHGLAIHEQDGGMLFVETKERTDEVQQEDSQ